MKRIIAFTIAAIALIGWVGMVPAAAEEGLSGNADLVLSEQVHGWNLSLEDQTTGQSETVVDSFHADSGTIVNNAAVNASYVKYQGLGDDDGLATAVLVQGSTLAVAWQPKNPESDVSVTVDGRYIEVGEHEASIEMVGPLGATVSILVEAEYADSTLTTGMQSTEFARLVVALPTTISAVSTSAAALAGVLPSKTTLRQNAFIPNASVAMIPNGVCSPFGLDSYRFVGDSRGFSPNDGASFRTRMDVGIAWGLSPTVSFTKLVGTTIRERMISIAPEIWVEDDRKTASSASMSYTLLSSSSSYVRFQTSQNVVNPFCNVHETNGITSTTTITVYRTGAVSGVIEYLAMPSHEIYLRQDVSPYSVIGRFDYQSPFCLVKQLADPFCTQSVTLRN